MLVRVVIHFQENREGSIAEDDDLGLDYLSLGYLKWGQFWRGEWAREDGDGNISVEFS